MIERNRIYFFFLGGGFYDKNNNYQYQCNNKRMKNPKMGRTKNYWLELKKKNV